MVQTKLIMAYLADGGDKGISVGSHPQVSAESGIFRVVMEKENNNDFKYEPPKEGVDL